MNLKGILDINKTISKDLFKETNYPWEVLPYIKDYIITLGNNLDKDNYTEIEDHIWVGSNVEIDKLSTIIAPCIIDENTIIRPGAYIRGNAIIGKNCVIGNSTEIKNDGTNIDIKYKGKKVSTGMRKMGSVVGDSTEVGCNSVLYPGTIIGKNTNIYPLTRVRGIINSNSIVKDENTVVDKEVNYDK